MTTLFVVDLTYLVELDVVEQHLEAHRAYLAENYERGVFLTSGRKEPRTGGVILARGDRSRLERILATDPFITHSVARYEITQFTPTMTAPELGSLMGPPTA